LKQEDQFDYLLDELVSLSQPLGPWWTNLRFTTRFSKRGGGR